MKSNSLQEMKDELEKPDDLSNLKERMNELKQQHLDDLQRMYASHAEDYFDDAMDRYLAKDDLQYLVQGENNPVAIASYAKLDVSISFFLMSRCLDIPGTSRTLNSTLHASSEV